MFRLYVLAALATFSIPVLMPQRFEPAAFEWNLFPIFMIGEILLSAVILWVFHRQEDVVRCFVFGLVFFLVRLVLCCIAIQIDPGAVELWSSEHFANTNALVQGMTYMYGAWYVTGTQYVVLLLWAPGLVEKLFPGLFPPKPAARPVKASQSQEESRSQPRLSRSADQPITFGELERELAGYPGLLAWIVFSPDKLPVWQAGEQVEKLEATPDLLRRLGDLCQPLLGPNPARDLSNSVFQTEDGYCVLATLPGGFLFSSLWRVEGEGVPARTVLQDVLERMERWLHYRFLESP